MTCYSGIEIKTLPGVYEPAEDTFLLADTIDAKPGEKVLDMGTGSGLLGLVAATHGGVVLAVDKSDAALRCAKENALLNGIGNFVVRRSDLFSNVKECFDLVLFNPPYLPTEEGEPEDEISKAWDGGRSGRDVIDRFIDGVAGHLNAGGRLLMIGSSLSDYSKTLEILTGRSWHVSIISRKKLDFEELVVIRAVYHS